MRHTTLGMLARGCTWILFFEAVSVSPAAAKRTQAQLTATFKDRSYPADRAIGPPPSCIVNFIGIIDERRSPEMAGVVGERGVLAPQDFKLWLQAVLGGLTARGIRPNFGSSVTADGAMPTASVTLQTAWIASTEVTYSANVVARLEASGTGSPPIDKVYRGHVSRTAYWSGGIDTLQSAMDGAFADALDAMAVDLRPLCGT